MQGQVKTMFKVVKAVLPVGCMASAQEGKSEVPPSLLGRALCELQVHANGPGPPSLTDHPTPSTPTPTSQEGQQSRKPKGQLPDTFPNRGLIQIKTEVSLSGEGKSYICSWAPYQSPEHACL